MAIRSSPANRALIEKTQMTVFRAGALYGTGPEVSEEEIVRAMMVVRANAMVYNAPSPQLSHMLMDFLNKRITPVVQSRGTLGEGDLAQLGNVGAAMVGAGDAYFQRRAHECRARRSSARVWRRSSPSRRTTMR